MKRAVEAASGDLRQRKIVALGAAMSSFAIVVSGESDAYEPEQLKNREIAVTPNNGSHFTTLKMMEGFLAPEHVRTVSYGEDTARLVSPGQSGQKAGWENRRVVLVIEHVGYGSDTPMIIGGGK